jgi:DNA uptake protein ComE-like DNA-binding protein
MSLAYETTVDPVDNRGGNVNPKTYRVILATEASKDTRDNAEHMEKLHDAARAQDDGITAKRTKLQEEKNALITRRHMTIAAARGSAIPKATLKAFDDEIGIIQNQLDELEALPKIGGNDFGAIVNYVLKRKDFATPDDLPVVDEFEATEDMLLEVTEAKTALRKELGKTEFTRRTKAEIVAPMIEELALLEKLGEPNLESLAKPDDTNARTGMFEINRGVGSIGWPEQFAQRGDDAKVFNSLAFQVWLHRAEIEKRFRAKIEKMPEGISAEEKVRRVADLHEKIAQTLRREHAILVALEKRGNLYLRKEIYHPAVCLGLVAPARLIAQFNA